ATGARAPIRYHHGRPLYPSPLSSFSGSRTFARSSYLSKKAKNKSPTPGSAQTATSSDDPYDFADLEYNITKAHDRLKDELSSLRARSKVTVETLENLRVQVNQSISRLGELAQVIPKGRLINVVCLEEGFAKPVAKAIRDAKLNLEPQLESGSAVKLFMNLPIQTAESRKAAADAAQKSGDTANTSIRDARGANHKKLKLMEKGKIARPDDIKKAGTKMEKIVQDASSETKKIVNASKQAFENG
ncbi:MAG: hypothetical protein M1831_000915, partial [Alyxoria varia]